jgi:membrane protease YdiL (CAAX protease family)
MSEEPIPVSDDQVGFSGPLETPLARPASWWLWPALVLVGIVNVGLIVAARYVANETLKTDLMNFAGIGLAMLPLMPLVTLAQMGNRSGSARLLALGYWGFFAIASVAIIGVFTFSGVFDFAMAERLPPNRATDAIAPGGLRKVAIASGLGLVAMFVGLLTFSEGGRNWAARWLPFDPNSFSSTTGLATVLILLAMSLIPLAVLGRPPLILLIENTKGLDEGPAVSNAAAIRGMYYQLIWSVPFALVAAGYPLVRTFPQALHRLGVGRLSFVQVIVSIAIAIGLVGLMQVLEPLISRFWTAMNWPRTDDAALEDLFKFALSGAGAVAIGITAGVCEELAFRGLLQPRLGLFLANLLFAAVHAFQYHWDALLLVFIIGFVCGLVRKWYNTTAAIIVHGLYDTLVVLAATYEWIK